MEQIGRDGHRSRMRDAYLRGNMKNAPEHNLLELFLSIIIPRKDVKQLSYDLINRFGSIEAVINASPYELMSVNGVGESTAIALSLVNTFNTKISVERNKKITKFKSYDDYVQYCYNILHNEKIEKVYIVTLTNSLNVINNYCVGEGNITSASVNIKNIITCAIKDNAVYVLITHNHPGGSAHPSGEDANFTVRIKDMLETINVKLLDHIIVGEDDIISLRKSRDYTLNL